MEITPIVTELLSAFKWALQGHFKEKIDLVIIPVEAELSEELITQVVSDATGISVEQMIDRRRGKIDVSEARMLAMYFCYEFLPNAGYSSIGRHFGGRDHSTVSSNVQAIKDRLLFNDRRTVRLYFLINTKLEAIKEKKPTK
ncbi:MAG TPA: helix-turn-helix domain-containing protein [Niabella sp.]|nr:helix-turn-helix domain-containing protein [Niabella sp.]